MLEFDSFDELNDFVGLNRSENFKDYFDAMDLSEEDKEKRISLAEKLEDGFLPILALLFTLQQYREEIDWEAIQLRFEIAYRNALAGVITADDYLRQYIRQFSYDVLDSTQNHMDDPFYFSLDRARLIAENEANSSMNYSDFQSAILAGKSKKQWMDIRDRKERETHRKVGRTIKPIQDPFMVGNSFMLFPKDTSMGADMEEIANCRCSIRYF